ncbi:MAG: glycosyltransferase family A protein [Leeuwenhoekiella sp.]
MQNTFLSIIIPLYNKAKVIKATIDSILVQDYENFEIIIVDDGSTDDSVTVVKQYDDARIKLFQKDNRGVSHTRNYGVQHSNSDWLFFLDADDTLLPGALRLYVDLHKEYPGEKFFSSNFEVTVGPPAGTGFCWGKKRQIIARGFKAVWERKIFPRTGCLMVHKDVYNEVGGFREDCVVWEDLEFVLNILERYQVVYTPECSFVHHFEFNELSQAKKPLENEYAYFADIGKADAVYHKLLLLEMVKKIKKKRLQGGDNRAVEILDRKLKGNGLILFFGQTERYIRKHMRKFMG